eukprot:6206520-Pleurochrysis_carterae.AAC.2
MASLHTGPACPPCAARRGLVHHVVQRLGAHADRVGRRTDRRVDVETRNLRGRAQRRAARSRRGGLEKEGGAWRGTRRGTGGTRCACRITASAEIEVRMRGQAKTSTCKHALTCGRTHRPAPTCGGTRTRARTDGRKAACTHAPVQAGPNARAQTSTQAYGHAYKHAHMHAT